MLTKTIVGTNNLNGDNVPLYASFSFKNAVYESINILSISFLSLNDHKSRLESVYAPNLKITCLKNINVIGHIIQNYINPSINFSACTYS